MPTFDPKELNELAKATQLLIDRDDFTLRLYKRPKGTANWNLVKRYRIAVGADGYNTPRGVYTVQIKDDTPEWYVPNESWAPPEKRGTVVSANDPLNPIKERWIGVTPPNGPKSGIGIHGTGDPDSIGSAASHGCIRMLPKDVIELYDDVPLGSTISIA